ncbi:hypothetical protein BDQ12DRAFT_677228 [Crucibulum laeve]|uniref:Thioredoxin domain-containing protein n=1 Tax=Crucibulum laeve TaxID=68775 RepID=A0A5C3M8T6_9AGAR|nr:hypothetical protein BDQ12DRAFT_677228 [Crucibulum laeve]
MPLYTADGSIDPHTLKRVPEQFLVFYSSIVDGKLWCPDCVAIEELVKTTFGPDGPSALIVYVGDRSQWKSPSNIYRGEPWKLTSVPTIIKLKDGKEEARLVDDEIAPRLAAFVKE